MRRRTLLTVGLAGGAVLAVAGGTLALLAPARRDGKLTEASRAIFAALGPAVLASVWSPQADALQDYLVRVQGAVDGLPPALQSELDELLSIAASPPGRRLLVGLSVPWAEASADELRAALAGMRDSSVALRQQAYHALRDLTNAAWFGGPATWASIGYPGPMKV